MLFKHLKQANVFAQFSTQALIHTMTDMISTFGVIVKYNI